MIRREMQLAEHDAQWWLVSQVEHARLSHDLATHCVAHFGADAQLADDLLQPIREELLQAILHHDDGWARWEKEFPVDQQHGRPLSFLELPLEESLTIWTDSISSAAQVGPLAAWTVAGHFSALLETSEENHDDPMAREWHSDMAQRRQRWLSDWQTTSPTRHHRQLADEALDWLQLFDVMSLWLCTTCPGAGEWVEQWPDTFSLSTEHTIGLRHPDQTVNARQQSIPLPVTVQPWWFDREELLMEAKGFVLSKQQYDNGDQVAEAIHPHNVRWSLVHP